MRWFWRMISVGISLALLLSAPPAGRCEDPSATVPTPEDPTLPEIVVTPAEDPQAPGTAYSQDTVYGPSNYSGDGPRLYNSPFTSPAAGGYLAESSTTGTKIDVPVMDFPGSVQSITRATMDDQEAMRVDDVLRNVSNVYRADTGGGQRDYMIIRGFTLVGDSSDYRKNGFRDVCRTQRDLANIERIEILKGPDSILYGTSSEPYGVVNFITKKPLDKHYRSAEAQVAYWDDFRFTFDTTGPFNERKNLLQRTNLAVQTEDSFRDFVYQDRFFISEALAYRIDADTTLSVEMEWLHDAQTPDMGIPLYNGSFRAVPISRFLGQPGDSVITDDGQVGMFLDRRVSDCLALRAGYVSNWSWDSREAVMTTGSSLVGVNGDEVRREVKDDSTVDSNHYFIGDITGEFNTGRFEHHLVFGTELGTNIRHKTEGRIAGTNVNIFNPDYSQVQPVPTGTRFGHFQYDQYGLYLQDLIGITPKLKLLGGVRWDAYDNYYFDHKANKTPTVWRSYDRVWSPRFGVVYQPIEELVSLYTSYSESFNPLRGLTRLDEPLLPETSNMVEVGIKLDLLDRRLQVTIAGFDIQQENVPVADPVDPDYDTQVGQVESKGVELDVLGKLTDRWSMIYNCAYTDARISEDTEADRLGNRLPNVPYYGTSLWTRYNLVQTRERTFGVGTGVLYRGFRQGDADNSYTLPAYARWDGGVYYRYRRLELALVAENLLDEFYIAVGKNQVSNTPGDPFNLTGSVRLTF